MTGKVLLARALPDEATALLEPHAVLEIHRDEIQLGKEALIQRLADKDALICQLTQRIDAEVLAAAPRLKVVANIAVGFDNVDLKAATERGVAVTNTPGVLDETTADFTWALLLALARRVVEGDHFVRSGKWRRWDLLLLLGSDVHGKTLGILGLGRIGRRVARRARGFDMPVLYNDAVRAPRKVERELKVQWASQEEVLRQADFLSLHVPLLPETRHLMSAPEFRLMKPSAFLINASRGPVVDEPALVEALEKNEIAGAALDVFEREPKIHPKLLTLPNVLLAPHIASASVATRTRMAVMAAENVVAMLRGMRPPNLVNPEIFRKK